MIEPAYVRQAVAKTIRIEYITVGVLMVGGLLRYAVMGESTAMLAAFLEELLEVFPAIAILATLYLENKHGDPRHPYGLHRIGTLCFFAAAIALSLIGIWVIWEGISRLLSGEGAQIGDITIFGVTFWQGWLMIAVLAITGAYGWPLAKAKGPLGKAIHLEALETDAEANTAHLLTSFAAAVGILLTGLAGLWWADHLVAIIIGIDIARDGFEDVRASMIELIDEAPEREDMEKLSSVVQAKPWVKDFAWMARKSGRYIEARLFIATNEEHLPELEEHREKLDRELREADWRVHNLVIAFGINMESLKKEIIH